MISLIENKLMNQLAIVFKSIAILCVALCTEFFIGCITLLSFIPLNVKDFFEEIKTPIAVLVSVSILVLTIIKIIKESKKEKK